MRHAFKITAGVACPCPVLVPVLPPVHTTCGHFKCGRCPWISWDPLAVRIVGEDDDDDDDDDEDEDDDDDDEDEDEDEDEEWDEEWDEDEADDEADE
ncbi:uncharacterized protein N0V89_000516 [Didymosphaeria variabile]|uniref:Uncharacterized protein n=1 Tax=Didymosphaeria variabile TaxID=1932322 RepID=A0A9W9CFT7_9PLEO|nr:uncharacterized protein N0V89_000516 [Didymosphaeria variabile]KAJ4359957.1 hypothetical protein N0V89_000516 [Didymosphaeria variabile]